MIRPIIGGTDGLTDGDIDIPGDGIATLVGGVGSVGKLHFRADEGETNSIPFNVPAPPQCEVSKDDISYFALVTYEAGEVTGQNDARHFIKRVSNDGPLDISIATSPRLEAVTVISTIPTLSAPLVATSLHKSVSLDWPNGFDDVAVTGYDVQYKRSVDSTWTDVTPDAVVSSCVISGLTNNTLYDFRVRAYDADGQVSEWLTAQATPAVNVVSDFETGGVDGQALATPWAVVTGPAAKFEYDNAHALGTLAGLIEASPGATNYAEYADTQGMIASTAEIRGALYLPNATNFRQLLDHSANFWVALQVDGTVQVITDRTATGYTTGGWTTVGNYAGGWLYWRVILDFSTDTYKLYTRTSEGAAWTPLKAAGAPTYDIPMKTATDRTQSGKLRISVYNGDSVWFDNIQAANAGLA